MVASTFTGTMCKCGVAVRNVTAVFAVVTWHSRSGCTPTYGGLPMYVVLVSGHSVTEIEGNFEVKGNCGRDRKKSGVLKIFLHSRVLGPDIQGLSKRFEHLLLWPPRSPDLTLCDVFLWGYVKDNAYKPQTARSHSSCGANH